VPKYFNKGNTYCLILSYFCRFCLFWWSGYCPYIWEDRWKRVV